MACVMHLKFSSGTSSCCIVLCFFNPIISKKKILLVTSTNTFNRGSWSPPSHVGITCIPVDFPKALGDSLMLFWRGSVVNTLLFYRSWTHPDLCCCALPPTYGRQELCFFLWVCSASHLCSGYKNCNYTHSQPLIPRSSLQIHRKRTNISVWCFRNSDSAEPWQILISKHQY